jgi:hypothetical protein
MLRDRLNDTKEAWCYPSSWTNWFEHAEKGDEWRGIGLDGHTMSPFSTAAELSKASRVSSELGGLE